MLALEAINNGTIKRTEELTGKWHVDQMSHSGQRCHTGVKSTKLNNFNNHSATLKLIHVRIIL